jgi:hypothetical protein
VSLVDIKDQSSSDLNTYATSKSERKILPKDIERGQKNVKNQLEKLVQMEKSSKQDLPLHSKHKKVPFKAHFIIVLKELRNRMQIEMQVQNQSNILEHKALIYPNGATRDNLTS